ASLYFDHQLLVLLTHLYLFTDMATADIYTLSLHDALPIWRGLVGGRSPGPQRGGAPGPDRCRRPVPVQHQPPVARACRAVRAQQDRKSTRLNSSHVKISYAVFCLKKKKKLKEKNSKYKIHE